MLFPGNTDSGKRSGMHMGLWWFHSAMLQAHRRIRFGCLMAIRGCLRFMIKGDCFGARRGDQAMVAYVSGTVMFPSCRPNLLPCCCPGSNCCPATLGPCLSTTPCARARLAACPLGSLGVFGFCLCRVLAKPFRDWATHLGGAELAWNTL